MSDKKNKDLDLVISRYNEDMSFLLDDSFKKYREAYHIIIYNKGPPIENKEVKEIAYIGQIPNVGRESHTYLHHIIQNYHNLGEATVFLPASFYATPEKKDRSIRILDETMEKKHGIFIVNPPEGPIRELHGYFQIERHESSSDDNKKILKEEDHRLKFSPERPYYMWFDKIFPGVHTDLYFYNGLFSVSKKDILKTDRGKYEELIKYIDDHPNPEVGHYMERSWCALFLPDQECVIQGVS